MNLGFDYGNSVTCFTKSPNWTADFKVDIYPFLLLFWRISAMHALLEYERGNFGFCRTRIFLLGKFE